MPFDMKWFSIFSLPNDGGLGFTSGMANQRSIFVLIDSNVWACLFQLDIRRYLRIQWHINLLATTQVLQYLTKNASRVLGFSQQLLCLQVCDKINDSTQCLKITENVSFYIASEASYVYILSHFCNFLKNSKTVLPDRTKIVGKCQSLNTQMWRFGVQKWKVEFAICCKLQ